MFTFALVLTLVFVIGWFLLRARHKQPLDIAQNKREARLRSMIIGQGRHHAQ